MRYLWVEKQNAVMQNFYNAFGVLELVSENEKELVYRWYKDMKSIYTIPDCRYAVISETCGQPIECIFVDYGNMYKVRSIPRQGVRHVDAKSSEDLSWKILDLVSVYLPLIPWAILDRVRGISGGNSWVTPTGHTLLLKQLGFEISDRRSYYLWIHDYEGGTIDNPYCGDVMHHGKSEIVVHISNPEQIEFIPSGSQEYAILGVYDNQVEYMKYVRFRDGKAIIGEEKSFVYKDTVNVNVSAGDITSALHVVEADNLRPWVLYSIIKGETAIDWTIPEEYSHACYDYLKRRTECVSVGKWISNPGSSPIIVDRWKLRIVGQEKFLEAAMFGVRAYPSLLTAGRGTIECNVPMDIRRMWDIIQSIVKESNIRLYEVWDSCTGMWRSCRCTE